MAKNTLTRVTISAADVAGKTANTVLQRAKVGAQAVGDVALQAGGVAVQAATSPTGQKVAVIVGKAALTTATGLVVTAILGPILGSLVGGITAGVVGLGGKAGGGTSPHV